MIFLRYINILTYVLTYLFTYLLTYVLSLVHMTATKLN